MLLYGIWFAEEKFGNTVNTCLAWGNLSVSDHTLWMWPIPKKKHTVLIILFIYFVSSVYLSRRRSHHMKPQPKVCSVNVKQKCLWVGLEDVFFGPHFTFLIGLITLPFLFLSSLLQTKHSIQRNHPCKHVNRLTNWWHTVGKYQNHLQPSCLVNFKLFLTGIAKIFREIWSKKICVQLCGGVVT